MEQKIELIQNGNYFNLPLKTKYKKNGKMLVLDDNGQKIIKEKGLDDGNFIIVEKKYAEGRANDGLYGTSYSCGVIYGEQECSFWLNEAEHDVYKNLGGQGDSVKISMRIETYTHRVLGVPMEKQVLIFESV